MKSITAILVGIFFVVAIISPAMARSENPRVRMETSKGVIVLELNQQLAPQTTTNFLSYVKSGFYDGTIFHRVIRGFMIQGGGFSSDMRQKPTQAPIMNEADNGLKNEKGTIAMARTGDPHSATSQFFINTVNNLSLNHIAKNQLGWGYCVFGRVVEGMGVVQAIENVPTTMRSGHSNVPVEPVVIKKVSNIADMPAKPQKPETLPGK